MNAYELADELDACFTKADWEYVDDAVNMLRQQADRIAELEKEKIRAYDNGFEDGQKANTPKTYIFDGKQVWDTTPQPKPLSDEEIGEIISKYRYENDLKVLCRAIEERHGIK